MTDVVQYLNVTRSIATLADSFAAVKLVQEELLRSQRFYKDVAKAAALAPTTVSRIASGETKLPRLETIIRLLGALDWMIIAQRRT